jgi:uncharacterized repeat protein (TIGR03803 family)
MMNTKQEVSRPYILCLLLAVATVSLAQNEQPTTSGTAFTDLAAFNGANGANPLPSATLIQGADGNLYGTTSGGGAYNSGTVFQMTPAGALNTFYSFCAQANCADGAYPSAGLVLGTDGNFYGVAGVGANYSGMVFQLTPTGTLTTLYNFCSQANCADGESPFAGLMQGTDGNFYGTTQLGGTGTACVFGVGCGTVFKITPSGTLTTLYSFNGPDGSFPDGTLIQASDGNFYGTTYLGGANNDGTVFQMTPAGTLTTLHNFDGTDGARPAAGLIQASDGNFYGLTSEGGAHGLGTLFRITPVGALSTLLSFRRAVGEYPIGALVQATDGGLYGTTAQGGANGYGTIFKINHKGFSTVYSFGAADGFGNSGLFEATNGTFYGTAATNNPNNQGTVFSLAVGLGPFVETVPTSGTVGETIQILGTDLTGATHVSFNGTAAAFTVVSASEITTIVPAGATTGFVAVKTASGKLKSNVRFLVRP